MADYQDNPLRAIKTHWMNKIHKAMEIKRKEFQDDADQAMYFFNGPYHDLYDQEKYKKGAFAYKGDAARFPTPSFGMSVNKTSELVQIFGPALYQRNPARKVTPRKMKPPPPFAYGDPTQEATQLVAMTIAQQLQQQVAVDAYRASLVEDYLSYTPGALDLKSHSRRAIEEALIKGAGCLWVDTYQSPGTDRVMVGSFYDTVDNLAIDPDMHSFEDAKWIAKRCVAPRWEVEAEYGLPKDTLKGSAESNSQQMRNSEEPNQEYKRAKGETNDLVVYWKVWSKMGMGSLLSGCGAEYDEVEKFGQFCYLVVSDCCEYPLNLPETLPQQTVDPVTGVASSVDVPLWGNDEEVKTRVQWPTPLWMGDAWPVKLIAFHWIPGKVWPMSHLKPVMGLIQFLNWIYSFLASKITKGIKDLIAIGEGAEESLKRALISGTDYEIITIKKVLGNINEQVQFLQHPPFHMDIWKIIELVIDGIEKGTGLSELAYGESSTQSRSAVDAQVKGENLKIRPDDMAEQVESAMSDLGWMEAFAAKWHLEPMRDIAPILGEAAAMFWEQQITAQPPDQILHLNFSVQAGSIRKKNFTKLAADADAMLNSPLFPLYQQYAMLGIVGPMNALIAMVCEAKQIEPQQFMIQPPPMPPMQEEPKKEKAA